MRRIPRMRCCICRFDEADIDIQDTVVGVGLSLPVYFMSIHCPFVAPLSLCVPLQALSIRFWSQHRVTAIVHQ